MRAATRVYLVGAGPGDADLLTVKAQRLLLESDVVVYDRLISADILDSIPPGVARISVGKQPGSHCIEQEAINALLVSLARAGRAVVRLKGGDPFVFGRGSEEALYLARHGIPFEIVPGITAASGCAAYAGIPLTHRGLASRVYLITGHHRANAPLNLDWTKLADPEATLVIYMGLAHLAEICQRLVSAGLPPDTPATAVENGTTARQRRCVSTLVELADATREAGMTSPVLVIIGRVVSLVHELDWYFPLPGESAQIVRARS